MRVSLIAAVSNDWVIGCNNELPWHLPADLRHFKRITSGHTVVMGRKTWQSIGQPLRNRQNIVLTRHSDLSLFGHEPEVKIAHSLSEAKAKAEDAGEEELFIIGGGQVFNESIAEADRIYLTIVEVNAARGRGDVFFPNLEYRQEWQVVPTETKGHKPDQLNRYAYTFYVYERCRQAAGTG